MDETIYNRFKDLPISFEYIYQQVLAMTFEDCSMRHLDELPLLANKLKLTPEETLVLAVVFHCQDKTTPVTQAGLRRLVSKFIGTNGEVDAIVELFKKLECIDLIHQYDEQSIKLKPSYYKLVKKNQLESLSEIKPKGLVPFLEYVGNKLIDSDFLELSTIVEELDFLSEINPDLGIVRKCISKMGPYDSYLVAAVCAKFYLMNEPFETSYFKLYMRGGKDNVNSKIRSILIGNWRPAKLGWLGVTGNGLMNEDVQLELTSVGIRNLLPELTDASLESLKLKSVQLPGTAIRPESIKKINLHFDEKMKVQINDLEQLMMPACFNAYQQSLGDTTRMRGLTVLLHGDPGTGKTELALQLARKSKRSLFQMNVTQVMSKWVGESEKNLKQLFYEYKRCLSNKGVAPVLFLNECDGLMSKRMDVTSSVDQMRNALQNIFLEEMENFEGILIATTNMTRNLDNAFERRFLYKVHFEKPGPEVTAILWKQFIPALRREEVNMLAIQFPFSPGEMQNVAQKLQLRQLLSKRQPAFQLVKELCGEEKLNLYPRKKMGFNQN